MAEEKKQQEAKKPETSKESVQTTETAAVKNSDAEKIQALQSENLKLKETMVRQKKLSSLAAKRKSGGSGIVGLQGLRGFGRK